MTTSFACSMRWLVMSHSSWRTSSRPASVGGLPGLEVDGSAQGARTEVFAVGRGYYVYTIMIGADAKAWDKLRPMLEVAAQTFTILK